MEKSRKQKIIIMSIAVIAVIGLTVAFAAMSTMLTINGTATMDTAKWDIHFANLSEAKLDGFASVTTEPELEQTKIGDYAVVLTRPGDSVTYTFDVVNEGSMDAELSTFTKNAPVCTSPTGVTNDANIVCSNLRYTFKYTSNNEDVKVNDTLKAGETKNITLQLSYEGSTLPTAAVNITDLGITMVYSQMIGEATVTVPASPEEWFVVGEDEYSGEKVITGFSENYDGTTDIVIPSTINGEPVTGIYYEAFRDTELTSVVISEGITTINSVAFYNCYGLSEVTLPSTLKEIGSQVFENTAITEISLPEGLTRLDTATFKGSSLQKINIPSGIGMIADELFMNTQLETIIIPEGIGYIMRDAFSGTNITSVEIPSTVEYMVNNAFTNMTSVTIKGKSSFEDFEYCEDGAISWAEGYSDENIIWEP